MKGAALTGVETVLLAVVLLGGLWLWNGAKFFSCDFRSDYKCEVIHGAGVFVPPLAVLTVWYKDDAD